MYNITPDEENNAYSVARAYKNHRFMNEAVAEVLKQQHTTVLVLTERELALMVAAIDAYYDLYL